MPGKQKFCDHCGEFASKRTYRRHSNLKLLLSSDEDESLVRQDNEVVMDIREEVQDNEHEVPGNNVLLFFW